ncbi:MAG: WecB/TagA/CpsF family glycosyltransferase [Isosphaeraceae bacterium]
MSTDVTVVPVWDLPIAAVTRAGAVDLVARLIELGRPSYFITASSHYAMLTHADARLAAVNADAAFIVADGFPLVKASRLQGTPLPCRVAGSDLIYDISERAARSGYRVFLLGAADGVAEEAGRRLVERYPGLELAGTACPPFRALSDEEHNQLLATIRAARPDVLFVAFGQPKGELWMHQNREALGVPVCVQIGASLDFVAGRFRRAPRWVQALSLEWLYRALQEPKRLIPRYLGNAQFLARMFARDLWRVCRGRRPTVSRLAWLDAPADPAPAASWGRDPDTPVLAQAGATVGEGRTAVALRPAPAATRCNGESSPVATLGLVTIGRNEGERLKRGLESIVGLGVPIVYVDSGSTDGSVHHARSVGVEVVELDLTRPFTAARARNAGLERLRQIQPELEFVQFLDGDCELVDGWLDRAVEVMHDRPRTAVAFGRLRERHPEHSLYNRMAEVEWNMPIGKAVAAGDVDEVASGGGNALVRLAALDEVGGFNPAIPVCEEPELCQRLRRAGWSVASVAAPMAVHDAALLHFRQWAKRTCRTGYGALDFTCRFGRNGDNPFGRPVVSAWLWGIGWPLTLLAGVLLAYRLFGAAAALVTGLLILAILPAQALRIARRNRDRFGDARSALLYGLLTVGSKFLHVYGQILYVRDRVLGRGARLIEHKTVL